MITLSSFFNAPRLIQVRAIMRSPIFWIVCAAVFFTLLPGQSLDQVLFSETGDSQAGLLSVGFVMIGIGFYLRRKYSVRRFRHTVLPKAE